MKLELISSSIGSTKDLDKEVGGRSYSQVQYSASPEERLDAYGDLLAPITEVLPEAQNQGRRDPIAMIGKGLGDQQTRKKNARAEKKLAKGKSDKMDEVEGGLKWVSRVPEFLRRVIADNQLVDSAASHRPGGQ